MSFIDRSYPDIVRDVLTSLTQGVTREVHRIEYDPDARPLTLPDVTLLRRPVRRISFVQGFVEGTDGEPSPHLFTLNDYDLIGNEPDAIDLDTIRFRPFGQKPAPDTDLTVNYYPRSTDPAPINDLNVGSVTRTLMEALSRELALLYAQLNGVYDSAFLETASGKSLDRVVALLGLRRFRAGRPAGTVVFRRRAGSSGSITIPAGAPITDGADTVRYLTVELRTLLEGESVAEVRVRGAAEATPPVEAGQLVVIQRSVAGIDSVSNERPTTRVNEEETDEDLRSRARAALLSANKGTVESIRFGLLQLPDVRDVSIEEFPNGVPGELRVNVALAQAKAGSALPGSVLERIEELRPAGIRVLTALAQPIELAAHLQLTLEGSSSPDAEIQRIRQGVARTLIDEVAKRGVGELIRNRPLTAALLADSRVVDVQLALGELNGDPAAPGADFQPPPDKATILSAENISWTAEAFSQSVAAGAPVAVEVRAEFIIELVSGAVLDDARGEIESRLKSLFAGLQAGASVTSESVLQAVRNDALYIVDPLKMTLTLTFGDRFAQIAQGGAAFVVQPDQSFEVLALEVSP